MTDKSLFVAAVFYVHKTMSADKRSPEHPKVIMASLLC